MKAQTVFFYQGLGRITPLNRAAQTANKAAQAVATEAKIRKGRPPKAKDLTHFEDIGAKPGRRSGGRP